MVNESVTTQDMAIVEQRHGLEKTRQLLKYRGHLRLTQEQALEILSILWPDAPRVDKMGAALHCVSYGLNPLAGHIFLIPYENAKTGISTWSRVMGIKAKRLLASRRGPYSYEDYSPRLMTKDEQEKVWGKVDTANISCITILRDTRSGATAYGYGKWPKGERVKGEGKGNSPENMASIRSESQALDRLRPGEMPEMADVVDEAYEVLPPTPAEVEKDIEELWGGKKAPTEAKKAPETPKTEDTSEKSSEATPASDPGALPAFKNYGEMAAWIKGQGLSVAEFLTYAKKKVWQEFGDVQAASVALGRWLRGEKG